jgi:hypothetical protein
MKKILLVVICLFSSIINAAQNTALVIGNSNYKKSPRLENPVNDASDIAKNLKKLGFEVIDKYDLTRKQMRAEIREFGKKLKKNKGAGIFFYAGHGSQVDGKNFLIPLGADINSETEVPDEAVEADLILRTLDDAKNPLNIIVLDACRDNPFASSFRSSSKGLASMQGGTGMLIAYSTAPGQVAQDGVGRNSPYTEHLLKNMTKTGLPIEEVFKQVRVGVAEMTDGAQTPWETSSLTGNFYFVPEVQSPHQKSDGVLRQPKVLKPLKKPSIQQPERLANISPVVSGKKLVIYTNPQNAVIRLINSKKNYHSGITLEPGDYNIEVSKAGFVTKKQWIMIDEVDVNLQVTLVPF